MHIAKKIKKLISQNFCNIIFLLSPKIGLVATVNQQIKLVSPKDKKFFSYQNS